MEILDRIPFEIDPKSLMASLRIEDVGADADDFAELVEIARGIGRPKAVYIEAFVDGLTDDTAVIGGTAFASRTLCRNLGEARRVFPYVATCGTELDAAFPPGSDILKDFWWDAIKTQLLAAALQHLQVFLKKRFRLDRIASMHPGSGDANVWPIEQQRPLFALLGDVRGAIGVSLTDTCLMLPNKTTSGIIYPAAVDFRSCEVCHRANCPNRHAEFNAQLWGQIHSD